MVTNVSTSESRTFSDDTHPQQFSPEIKPGGGGGNVVPDSGEPLFLMLKPGGPCSRQWGWTGANTRNRSFHGSFKADNEGKVDF